MPVLSSIIRNAARSVLKSRDIRACSTMAAYTSTLSKKYETVAVSVLSENVFHVELNRPDKLNAMNKLFYQEFKDCFETIAYDPDVRVVVLSGKGRLFSAGIDLSSFAELPGAFDVDLDTARRAKGIRQVIELFQGSFTAIEKCSKPVIAAVHGACVGGGIDLITATDMRYGTADSWYQVKEVDMGLAADLGTLQRLPKIIGNDGAVREMVYTARKVKAEEALSLGLISKIFPDKDAMLENAKEVARTIADKSPVAVQTSKESLVFSRDHSVADGLDHIKHWNMGVLQSEDTMKSVQASMSKTTGNFSKL